MSLGGLRPPFLGLIIIVDNKSLYTASEGVPECFQSRSCAVPPLEGPIHDKTIGVKKGW